MKRLNILSVTLCEIRQWRGVWLILRKEKKHDAPKTEGEVLAMEKGTVGSATLPLPATLSGEAEARAFIPTPVSLPWGMCSSSSRLDFSNPVAASPAPQAWSEEAITKVKKESKPWEEFNSPTSVFRLSLTLWFEVKLDCV